MNVLTTWLKQLRAGHRQRAQRLHANKSDAKRIAAIKDHIGDKQRLLQQCRNIDHCRGEEEIIDILAKASLMMKIDPSFKEEFEALQRAAEISEATKMILHRIKNE